MQFCACRFAAVARFLFRVAANRETVFGARKMARRFVRAGRFQSDWLFNDDVACITTRDKVRQATICPQSWQTPTIWAAASAKPHWRSASAPYGFVPVGLQEC